MRRTRRSTLPVPFLKRKPTLSLFSVLKGKREKSTDVIGRDKNSFLERGHMKQDVGKRGLKSALFYSVGYSKQVLPGRGGELVTERNKNRELLFEMRDWLAGLIPELLHYI
ncbi:hypothetical protein CEXT_320361 [Caerostris extrusa]|uniref:Uncharacterized protein n=1 Tax=Caerostris extrusa TaxID=172846 RepID=A0AAV4UX12_CAEEX|nr:hypothetical protein CEXT_320361 [Caerostris extrusa]